MGNLISIIKYNNKDMCFNNKQNNKQKETKTREIMTPEYIPSPHLPIPMNL